VAKLGDRLVSIHAARQEAFNSYIDLEGLYLWPQDSISILTLLANQKCVSQTIRKTCTTTRTLDIELENLSFKCIYFQYSVSRCGK
jgi:hypothetical protein